MAKHTRRYASRWDTRMWCSIQSGQEDESRSVFHKKSVRKRKRVLECVGRIENQ